MLRLTSDCYCLSKEKIEDVSSTLLFSLVVEYPYYQEGILIRKLWGNQFTYTFLTLSLPSSGVCERESFPCLFPFLSCSLFLPSGCTALWSGCTAGSCRSPAFARAVVPLPPGGGTATMLCNSWGGGSVHALLKYRSRFWFDAILGR